MFIFPTRPPAFLSVQDTVVTEGDTGYTTAVFAVTLSTPLAQTTRVDYATHDLTATSGRDYLSTNGTLVFLPGITRQDIQVKIPGDLLAEPTHQRLAGMSGEVVYYQMDRLGRCIADRDLQQIVGKFR